MLAEYQSGVNKVTGSLGPLYYAQVQVEGVPVEAMIGSGSSATVTSFALFKEVGRIAKIPSEALEVPDVILRDYNCQPIPIGARVKLNFKWHGESVTAPVYVRSDLATAGSPDCWGRMCWHRLVS